jgi:hypothetical protein
MGVTLEAGPSRRGCRTAALVRTERHAASGPKGAGLAATKRPLVVLIDGPTGIAAYAPSGTALDLTDLRRRYPDLLAAFEEGGAAMSRTVQGPDRHGSVTPRGDV